MLDISIIFKHGTTEVEVLELLQKVGVRLTEKSILSKRVYTFLVTGKQLYELKFNSLVNRIDIDGDTYLDINE